MKIKIYNKLLVFTVMIIILTGFDSAIPARYTMLIEITGEQNYKAVPLPPIVLNLSGTGAIRIFNETAEEYIPFFVHGYTTKIKEVLFNVETSDGITTVTLTGFVDNIPGYNTANFANLTGVVIDFETSDMFQRTVGIRNRSIELYQFELNDIFLQNTSFDYPRHLVPRENISFEIINHDDRPLAIDRVWISYNVYYAVFEAYLNNRYYLHFGGGLTQPFYDIQNFANFIIEQGYDVVQLVGEPLLISQYVVINDSEPRDFTVVFNIAIAATSILLIVIGALTFRKKV